MLADFVEKTKQKNTHKKTQKSLIFSRISGQISILEEYEEKSAKMQTAATKSTNH